MATYSFVSGNTRGSIELDPTATPVPEGVDPADVHAAVVEEAVAKAKADVTDERMIYCHGCGDEIAASAAHWHNGDGYCDGCESAPAEAR